MFYLDLTLPAPAENLALDEALLLEAEDGRLGETLRLWELPAYAVVLGSGGRLQDDVQEAACQTDEVPILRRCSGGGAVLLGPGCLCFSLILNNEKPPLNDITHSYRHILRRLQEMLAPLAPGVRPAGTCDLAVDDLKVSGNSQRRLRRFLLHHGTLLHDFPAVRLERYLKHPARQPAYRRERDHAAFITNLPGMGGVLRQALRLGWNAGMALQDWPRERVACLVRDKYGKDDWLRRR